MNLMPSRIAKTNLRGESVYNSTEERITYFIGVLRFVLLVYHKFGCFALVANCFARKLRKCLIQECQISQEMLVQCSGMR